MDYAQLEQHVGHPIQIAPKFEGEGADEKPVGLEIGCEKCDEVLAVEYKTLAEGAFTKHNGEWAIKVENGSELDPGTVVLVTVFKTGEQKKIQIGELLGTVEGRFPGRIYANEKEV